MIHHIVNPKKDLEHFVNCCGDFLGVTAIVNLKTSQKWKAKKSKGYWLIKRKGCPITIRLTEAAFNRLFIEVEK